MCLLALAVDVIPEYPLVVLANRDEFYSRQTSPMGEWPDHAGLLAGRDLQAGGTWMGCTKSGRFAALTNYRDPTIQLSNTASRGLLVADFLTTDIEATEYARRLRQSRHQTNGYNLVFGRFEQLLVYSNVDDQLLSLGPGVHGLSNHLLGTDWPKVTAITGRLTQALTQGVHGVESLMELLADRQIAPDSSLPDTGVGLALERGLSAVFVALPQFGYGTRSTTVLRVGVNEARMLERRFDRQGRQAGESLEQWTLGGA